MGLELCHLDSTGGPNISGLPLKSQADIKAVTSVSKMILSITFGLLFLAGSVRPDLDFKVLVQNPEALQELGHMVASQIRSGKPSDLVRSVGVEEDATVLNEIPGTHEAKSVLADVVENLVTQKDLIKVFVGAAQDNPDLVDEVQKLVGEILTLQPQVFELIANVAKENPELVDEGHKMVDAVVKAIQSNPSARFPPDVGEGHRGQPRTGPGGTGLGQGCH